MTPRERMDAAAKEFEIWFCRFFLDIGASGPTPENARLVFDHVTGFIADVERKFLAKGA
jgi:hypothetical protein